MVEDMAVNSADVLAMRDWLLKQAHLPQNLDDRLLARFLLCCDGSLERTKTTLDLFFTLRADTTEVFTNRDPFDPDIQDALNIQSILPLEELTPEGYSCFIYHFGIWDLEKFNILHILKSFFMMGDTQIRSEKLDLVPGLVVIIDASTWTLKYLPKVQFSTLKKCFEYVQEAQPVRVKQIHIINSPPFLDKFFAVFSSLIKVNVFEMIHIHPAGSVSLYEYIPREILPKEYGGQAESVKTIKERWKKEVESDKEWFLKDDWMTDESKRIGKRNGLIGSDMEGSFRLLSID